MSPTLEPDVPETPSVVYGFDTESIARTPDPQAVVDFLVEVVSRPGFRLSRVCGLCEAWDRGYLTKDKEARKPGLGLRPRPPGAEDATYGCHGCWYSYLEEPPMHHIQRDRGFSEYLLARMREGLDTLPEGRQRREYEARIAEVEALQAVDPDLIPRKRGRVLLMTLEVVE